VALELVTSTKHRKVLFYDRRKVLQGWIGKLQGFARLAGKIARFCKLTACFFTQTQDSQY
jgi:hypothetical protein